MLPFLRTFLLVENYGSNDNYSTFGLEMMHAFCLCGLKLIHKSIIELLWDETIKETPKAQVQINKSYRQAKSGAAIFII